MADFVDPTLGVRLLSVTRNQDLSDWSLISSDQKSLCRNLVESGLSVIDFCNRHVLALSTIKRYMKKYRVWKTTGIDTFHDSKGGRPPKVDDDGIIHIRQCLRAAVATQSCQTTMLSNFQIMIEDEVKASLKRRGQAGLDGLITKRFVKRFKIENNFVEATCQFKTHARIFAEADPRNLFSFAVMNEAFMGSRDASMCFNWDATQYCVDAEGHTTIVKCKGDDEKPATAQSAGGLAFAIKYYHFHNAAGDMAPMVLIVADDSMEEGEFFFAEVPGLSHTQLVDAVGYLVFTKTRNCNAAFYRWYAHTVVAPFVLKCRQSYDNKNPDGTPMRAFVVCDGEPSQIQVFQEGFILQLMAESLIDFGKSPASCSGITQASDDSDFFKASKKKLVRIREADYIHPGLDKRLKELLLARRTTEGEHRLTSARRVLIGNSLQQVVYSIQHVLTPEIVKAVSSLLLYNYGALYEDYLWEGHGAYTCATVIYGRYLSHYWYPYGGSDGYSWYPQCQ
jgi:transposase